MKLNFHRKRLYLFVNFLESDRYKVTPFFEDYDETFINYDYDSRDKVKEYNLVGWRDRPPLKNVVHQDFEAEFFSSRV